MIDIFVCTRVWTQDLYLLGSALSHMSIPFYFRYFSGRVLCFSHNWPQTTSAPLTYSFLLAGITSLDTCLLIFVVLGFELRASVYLGKCCTTWATHLAFFALLILNSRPFTCSVSTLPLKPYSSPLHAMLFSDGILHFCLCEPQAMILLLMTPE
jgi:hypothetical protein